MDADTGQAQAEMPKYRCHKEVHALKIKEVKVNPNNGVVTIVPEDKGFMSFNVSAAYCKKHTPQAGGYYVVYADGYASWSPAEAFEDGYTRI